MGTYDPRFDCKNFINQNVTPNPCPSAEVVKKIGADLLNVVSNVWEKNEGSPIGAILQGTKIGEGLDIPLDAPKTTKYRLSLDEIFRYHYDASDRSLPVNNQKIKYINEQGQEFNESLTILERIETVIREVRFGNNYLGVAYLNNVVHGDEYNKDVQSRKGILDACIKIPIIRCGKPMSASDIRMTYNALATYDGLLDINNGLGRDSRFHYGNFLKTFQQTLVGSSAKKAQAAKFFPLEDKELLKHNGKALVDITMLTGLSNTGRFIRDRIGRSREDFEAFLSRPDFKRVDRTWLYGFELQETIPSAERLIKKIKDQHILDDSVDWLSNLNYGELRLVEDTGARLLVVASFLGTPDIVFEKKGYTYLNDKYKNNNISKAFLALEKIIDYWATIKKIYPGDASLIDLIKPINTGLYFLTEKLNSTQDPEKNIAYLALNDVFLALQTMLFEDLPDARILAHENITNKGQDFLLGLLNDENKLDFSIHTLREDYHYFNIFYQQESEWFQATGQNLQRLAMEPRLELTPLRDYINFTTKNAVCLYAEKACEKNYHYDEIANLLNFLQQKTDNGETNFMLANKTLLLENLDQVVQIITDIFPAIKIKEVYPPLIL